MTPPLDQGIRGTDSYGSGAFGASRDGGTRTHAGVDLICTPGEPVLSPCAGTVTMHGVAYADDHRFRTMRIVDADGIEYRLLYVEPITAVGRSPEEGALIATAQDISLRYPGITQHVHFEMRRDGVPIDPTPMLVNA